MVGRPILRFEETIDNVEIKVRVVVVVVVSIAIAPPMR